MYEIIHAIEAVNSDLKYSEDDWIHFRNGLTKLEKLLFDQIKSKDELSDHELSDIIFKTDPNYREYGALKLRLQKKISRELLNYRPKVSKTSSFQKAYYYLMLDFSVFQVLIAKGRRKIAFDLGKRIFKTAQRYQITWVNFQLCLFFSEQFGKFLFDGKSSERYFVKCMKYHKLLGLEAESAYANSRITQIFYGKIKPETSQIEELSKLVKNLRVPTHENTSFKYAFSYFMSHLKLEMYQGKYSESIIHSEQALNYFKNIGFEHLNLTSNFIAFKASALLQLDRTEEAKESLTSLNETIDAGRIQWYNIKELMLLIHLKEKDYEAAHIVYLGVISNKTLKNQIDNVQETWRLFNAYITFLIQVRMIEHDDLKHRRFRIRKFLNEVPQFDKQKQLMNIPIIIVQLLFAVVDRDYDAIEDRVYALKGYCAKYLKKTSSNYRSHCFIKMLLKIPNSNFHPVSTRRNAELFRKRLSEIPLKISEQRQEIEVIPYEDLWEIILKYLKSPRRKRTSQYTRQDFMEHARAR